MSPRVAVLPSAALAGFIDEVLAEDVGPALIEILAEGRQGSTAVTTTSEAVAQLRPTLDELVAAMGRRARAAYVAAAAKIAALAVVLLLARRLDTGNP